MNNKDKEILKEIEERFNDFYESVLEIYKRGHLDKGVYYIETNMFPAFRFLLAGIDEKYMYELSEEGKEIVDEMFYDIVNKLSDEGIELEAEEHDPTVLYIRKMNSDDDEEYEEYEEEEDDDEDEDDESSDDEEEYEDEV